MNNAFLILLVALFLLSCDSKIGKEKVGKGFYFEEIADSTGSSIRGISINDQNEVWFSGSSGLVLKLDDDNLIDVSPNGYETLDFRSIYSFNDNQSIIMSVGSPAVILKTIDGGSNWTQVYVDSSETAFYNAVDFWNRKEGVAFGDPINEKFSVLRTNNGGESWFKLDSIFCPVAFEGEAGFAASGTNMSAVGDSHLYYLTGGSHSRMLFSADKGGNWLSFNLLIRQGKESEGGYSFAVNRKGEMVVVGGDYTEPNEGENSCCISFDKGMNWSKSSSFPSGYRSCVEFINDSTLIAVGTSGMDFSKNVGSDWQSIDTTYNLNVVKFINDSLGYAAGNGMILRIMR